MGFSDRGDEQRWFAALFEAHHPAVVRYAGRRLSPDAAGDVAAEVFLVAWRRRDEVPDNAVPWLFGVARRVIANQRRGAVRHDRLAERVASASVPSTHAGADVVVEQAADVSTFAAAFARLSDDDRDVLGLVAWEHLTIGEIAHVLGCSVPAATMRLHRARRRLRAALDAPTTPAETTCAS